VVSFRKNWDWNRRINRACISNCLTHKNRHPTHQPQPNQRHWNIDRPIGGIDPACCCGMKGEQPREERQWQRRRNEQKRRSASLEHQIGQIAPNNLSDCRKDEKQGGPNHDSGTGINRCSHFNRPQDTTPDEPPAVPPSENIALLGVRLGE